MKRSERYRPSDAETHYKHIASFFKWLIGIVIFVFTVSGAILGVFIGNNVNEIKAQLRDELTEIKNGIRVERQSAIDNAKVSREELEKQLANLRRDSEAQLNFIDKITQMQIEATGKEARSLAISSAHEKVAEIFKTPVIESMVQSEAKHAIGTSLNVIVAKEMESTSQLFENLSNLTRLYDGIGREYMWALKELDSIAYNDSTPIVRRSALKLLLQKGLDYDAIHDAAQYEQIWTGNVTTRFLRPKNHADSLQLRSRLCEIILTEDNIDNIVYCFLTFRHLLGLDIKTFDMESVRQLQKQIASAKP